MMVEGTISGIDESYWLKCRGTERRAVAQEIGVAGAWLKMMRENKWRNYCRMNDWYFLHGEDGGPASVADIMACCCAV